VDKKKEIIRKKIKNIPNNAKIILYRNPKEFSYFNLEKINPTHKIQIWGKLKKKHRKGNNLYINAGKILIPSFFLTFVNFEILIQILPSALISFLFVDLYLILTMQEEFINIIKDIKKSKNVMIYAE